MDNESRPIEDVFSKPNILKKELSSPYGIFLNDLIVLREINRIVPTLLQDHLKTEREQMRKINLNEQSMKELHTVTEFLNKFITKNNKSTSGEISVGKDVEEFLLKHILLIKMPEYMSKFLGEMSIVYLVASFEQFLSESLRTLFLQRREIMKSFKSLTIEEILSVGTYEEILNLGIKKECDSLINDGIDKILQYFSDKLKLDLNDNHSRDKFTEVFYRRNVIIHNNGIPDEVYTRKTNYSGQVIKLEINQTYLRETLDLFENYSKLIHTSLSEKFNKVVS